jgi:hypothetical protein
VSEGKAMVMLRFHDPRDSMLAGGDAATMQTQYEVQARELAQDPDFHQGEMRIATDCMNNSII